MFQTKNLISLTRGFSHSKKKTVLSITQMNNLLNYSSEQIMESSDISLSPTAHVSFCLHRLSNLSIPSAIDLMETFIGSSKHSYLGICTSSLMARPVPVSAPSYLLFILLNAAVVKTLKHESDHITILLRTLRWELYMM